MNILYSTKEFWDLIFFSAQWEFYKKIKFNDHREIRPLKTRIDKDWYVCIQINCQEKSYNRFVHRILAQAFIPNPSNLECINHKNGIRDDNRLSNLEWCSRADNNLHGIYMKRNLGIQSLSITDPKFVKEKHKNSKKSRQKEKQKLKLIALLSDETPQTRKYRETLMAKIFAKELD